MRWKTLVAFLVFGVLVVIVALVVILLNAAIGGAMTGAIMMTVTAFALIGIASWMYRETERYQKKYDSYHAQKMDDYFVNFSAAIAIAILVYLALGISGLLMGGVTMTLQIQEVLVVISFAIFGAGSVYFLAFLRSRAKATQQ